MPEIKLIFRNIKLAIKKHKTGTRKPWNNATKKAHTRWAFA